MKVINIAVILGALLIAGCSSDDAQQVSPPSPTPFTQALTQHYSAFVAEEREEYDWKAGKYYARKGNEAANGEAVLPEEITGVSEASGGTAAAPGTPGRSLPPGPRSPSIAGCMKPRKSMAGWPQASSARSMSSSAGTSSKPRWLKWCRRRPHRCRSLRPMNIWCCSTSTRPTSDQTPGSSSTKCWPTPPPRELTGSGSRQPAMPIGRDLKSTI